MKIFLVLMVLISDLAMARGQAVRKGPPLTAEEYSKLPGSNTVEQVGNVFYVPEVTGQKIGNHYLKTSSHVQMYRLKIMKSMKSDQPEGTILSQDPKAGSKTLTPGEINVIVSSGK